MTHKNVKIKLAGRTINVNFSINNDSHMAIYDRLGEWRKFANISYRAAIIESLHEHICLMNKENLFEYIQKIQEEIDSEKYRRANKEYRKSYGESILQILSEYFCIPIKKERRK